MNFVECNIRILPSNEKTNDDSLLALDTKTNILLFAVERLVTHFNSNKRFKTQHLYVLSNDEIKEGDWCIDYVEVEEGKYKQKIYKKIKGFQYKDSFTERKIIASTDKTLGLPELPVEFIESYYIHFNNWNKIDNVVVEYEYNDIIIEDVVTSRWFEPKTSKDNTINIIISHINYDVDSEKEKFIQSFFSDHQDKLTSIGITSEYIKKWCKENL